ncbi:galactose oxidase [Mucilaginibacter angelicae]|uniref:Galactose oxidase n=1 Tax=Mucilaginibacter angelicae TaxID=869718 RepID=A0ABV6L002_9SPHI
MGKFYLLYSKVVFVAFFCFAGLNCFAQNYGLRFASHEVVQDKRTSLELSPQKGFCFNGSFELSFDISFFPAYNVYFGYVVRIVSDDKRNFDLVYNTAKNHFELVTGDKEPQISFDISQHALYNQWNRIRISFDASRSRLQVFSGGKTYTQQNVTLSKIACYRITFGTNNHGEFETTDVPPMKIRDIQIVQSGNTQYKWPLNETDGNIAHEQIRHQDASIVNPVWVSLMHRNWSKVQAFTVNGMASVSFDQDSESLFVIATDTVYTYDINTGIVKKNAAVSKLNLNQGNRAIYNPLNKSLYSFYTDARQVSRFNFSTNSWQSNFKPGQVTRYWHINKIISQRDSSMYLFGGYGYLLYHNQVLQYHFNTNKWDSIIYKGDFYMPRYLAATGATSKGDTAYILGGYGNASGKQILTPKYMYDMMRYTVSDHTFKKMFEIAPQGTDGFTFANSLVVDPENKNYYALIFPRHIYNSTLKLIRGSLSKPAYQVLESGIPYQFHDVHSFADLYFAPRSNKFIVVTLLRSEAGQTGVAVYTLLGPPLFQAVRPESSGSNPAVTVWAIAAIGLIAGGAVYLTRKRQPRTTEIKQVVFEPRAAHFQRINDQSGPPAEPEPEQIPVEREPLKNTILLFGGLQIFDAGGTEITKLFTPLIKEIFLLMLLYTIRLGRGISSERLNEMFWIDKPEKRASNNRSVSIIKLKTLLEGMDHCRLSKETGAWTIDIDPEVVYVDYNRYLTLIKNKRKLNKQKIKELSDITQRGQFLPNSDYDWLDSFKSEISNDIINTYLYHARSAEFSQDPEFLIELANFIFYFDPVNEDAMILKCKAFSALGKHSLAKHTFENFSKTYKAIYERDFEKEFQAIVS